MSSLPGGGADKIGNRYEQTWTVFQCARLLHGFSESIHLEKPRLEKVEFEVSYKDHTEFHQVKSSNRLGKWSLNALAAADDNILGAMLKHLHQNKNTFCFVSTSNAHELRQLSEDARRTKDFLTFQRDFLAAGERQQRFASLNNKWAITAEEIFDILSRIHVHTIDEKLLEEYSKNSLAVLFLADPSVIFNNICKFVADSTYEKFTADSLFKYLADLGYLKRKIVNPHDTDRLISSITQKYEAQIQQTLINRKIVTRSVTEEIIRRIQASGNGDDYVLIGKAGTGKSACIYHLIQEAKKIQVKILAFRLDRIRPTHSSTEIGKELGLEESPSLSLAEMKENEVGLLIIDQLDIISTISGRNSDFFEAVSSILQEIRELRKRAKLHTLIVCRNFDWEHDHRLRALNAKDDSVFLIAELDSQVTGQLIQEAGYAISDFSEHQINLLRLPQNLSLFLESDELKTARPDFRTEKNLFDKYWENKKLKIESRYSGDHTHWLNIIECLSSSMTETNQLYVAKEKLDSFAGSFLDLMASEGVITNDGKVVGFGHESFFDYCFARIFVGSGRNASEFLVHSDQSLFRRSQIRQILVYLRASSVETYLREITSILRDAKVRTHIIDLVSALIFNQSDPTEKEWNCILPFLERGIRQTESEDQKTDRTDSLIWRHFFQSKDWFYMADQHGKIQAWLGDSNNAVIDRTIEYLRYHQRHSSEKIASYLTPFAKMKEWSQRLVYLIEWGDHGQSRAYFDFILNLLDTGVLDEAKGPIAVNSTFWSLFHTLMDDKPQWFIELIAHWLLRRINAIQDLSSNNNSNSWGVFRESNHIDPNKLRDIVDKHPKQFIDQILGPILKLSDLAIYREDDPPQRDAIWPRLFFGNHYDINDILLESLNQAFAKVASTQTEQLKEYLVELKSKNTYIRNYLLLWAYKGAISDYASEAITLICDEPWRLECGYSDNPYWVASLLIASALPSISSTQRVRLLAMLGSYSSEFEKTEQGAKDRGYARFNLIKAIPDQFRDPEISKELLDLEKRFKHAYEAPKVMEAHFVGSPIEEHIAEAMTNTEWLREIKKYNGNRETSYENFHQGGSRELSLQFSRQFTKDPERFGKLTLEFDLSTNSNYIYAALSSLRELDFYEDLKIAICRKAYENWRDDCSIAICDILGKLQQPLPDDLIQMLIWISTNHPDPISDTKNNAPKKTTKTFWDHLRTKLLKIVPSWFMFLKLKASDSFRKEVGKNTLHSGGHEHDLHSQGINCTRGRAAEAIARLIGYDARYIEKFRATTARLVNDPCLSVRSCAARILTDIGQSDIIFSIQHFHQLIKGDDSILSTYHTERFIYYYLREHPKAFRPIIKRMIFSSNYRVQYLGSILLSLLNLYTNKNKLLLTAVSHGYVSHRLGIATVAKENLIRDECREWSKKFLKQFFDDQSSEVRQKASSCFAELEEEELQPYEKIFHDFCNSEACNDATYQILRLMEETRHELPEITIKICKSIIDRLIRKKGTQSGRTSDLGTLAKLSFRSYAQRENPEQRNEALDLIDELCFLGFYGVSSEFKDFDRS